MPFRRLPCLLLCLLVAPFVTSAAADCDRDCDHQCRKIDQDIRKIEARMRRPYTATQGVRFDERLRELKRRRYKYCR